MLLTHASLNYLNTLSPFFSFLSILCWNTKFCWVITSLNSQVTGIKFYTISSITAHWKKKKKKKNRKKKDWEQAYVHATQFGYGSFKYRHICCLFLVLTLFYFSLQKWFIVSRWLLHYIIILLLPFSTSGLSQRVTLPKLVSVMQWMLLTRLG